MSAMQHCKQGVAAAAFAPLLLAACAAGGARGFTPTDWTQTGEIKIGRFTYTMNKLVRSDQTVYRALLSKTWLARRGDRLEDDFARLAYAGTAPIEDWAMAELLAHFVDGNFFSLPQRSGVRKEDMIPADRQGLIRSVDKSYSYRRSSADPALRYSSDALIVETDLVRAVVLLNDCSGDAQIRAYARCIKDFESIAAANPPAVIGVGVEPSRLFLKGRRPALLEEPPPTIVPKRLKLRSSPPEGTTPDAGDSAPAENPPQTTPSQKR